ncbi:hypothetical protein [Streptomyces sp. NPDC127038]|uniref:hypothetical protein n=1 Tax=Streptomyces sp. NPDC127038 TaxID=3347114 RepID=UPI00365D705E
MAPGLVPQVAGLRRRLALLPAPARSSGEASDGNPVLVELWVSGAWVDITGYTLVRDDSGNISLSRGIRDEGSQTEAGTCSLQLDNRDGRFSPRNPMGPYFGAIGRNTPVRVSVPDGMGGKSYRVWGEISEWVPNWDTSGSDVWTDATAAGILRRLAQGPVPDRSVIYNAVTDPIGSQVVGYWPMEDVSGSTKLASGLPSGSPMTMTGTPELASYTGFGASDPLPDLSSGYVSGGVAKYDDPTATQVRFLVFIPATGLTTGKVICSIDQVDYSAGATQFWELYYGNFAGTSTSLTLRTCASDGTNLGADLESDYDVRGKLLYVSVELQESGTGITRAVRITNVSTGATANVSSTAGLTQLTRVTRVQFGPASRSVTSPIGTQYLPGVAVGHCTVENAISAVDALGRRLNPVGEPAGRRIQRLCSEEGIPFDWVGDLDDTVPLGAQGKQNMLSLVQEAVLADGGMLYENRSVLGLGYRTRASLCNQDAVLALDYAGAALAQVPTPVEDDRYIQNRVTVTVNGITGTYEETSGRLSTALPPAGVGVYGQDTTLNLATSDTPTLLDHAAWRVHLGTVDEARFPTVSVNLAHPSITPTMRRAILAIRAGDRIQITNPPVWLPPDTIDQLVLGTSETISRFEHRLTFNCQPASPFNQIGYLDGSTARIDTDDSALLAAVSSGATSLDVAPVNDPSMLWTTDTAEVPWDIRVGGEVMRVTAVSSKLVDAFGRTSSSSWGSADSGQAWTTSGGTGTDYAVGSGVGTHTLGSVDVSRRCFTDIGYANFDLYGSVTTSAAATGAPIYAALVGRYIDIDGMFMARLAFSTANVLTMAIVRRIGGAESVLASSVLSYTYTPGAFFRIRFQGQGARLRAKAWPVADLIETPEWQVTVADGSHSSATSVGTRSILEVGNTNVSPVVSYDNLAVVNPQTFTVTRSINGVVKAQAAGTDIRLATPTYFSL